MSSARMDAWARSAISTLAGEGRSRSYICTKVAKKDGTRPHIRAVDAVLAKVRANPAWRGEDSQAGGRPRALTDSQRKQLVALVFKMRGRAVVTSAFCKRYLKFLRACARCAFRSPLWCFLWFGVKDAVKDAPSPRLA